MKNRSARFLLLLALALAASPAAADEYPTALIDRPLVLPGGLLQLEAALGHQTRRALGVEILSAEDMALAGRLGVTGRWEVGAASWFRLHPDAAWQRGVGLSAAYRAFAGERIDIAPGLELPLSFHHGYDLVDTAWLGLGLRARLTDRLFAVAGRRLVPVDIRPAFGLSLALDGGIGVQATPALAFLAETQGAVLTVVGPNDRTTSAVDRWPVAVTALWATPTIDTAFELRSGSALTPGDDFAVVVRIGVRP